MARLFYLRYVIFFLGFYSCTHNNILVNENDILEAIAPALLKSDRVIDEHQDSLTTTMIYVDSSIQDGLEQKVFDLINMFATEKSKLFMPQDSIAEKLKRALQTSHRYILSSNKTTNFIAYPDSLKYKKSNVEDFFLRLSEHRTVFRRFLSHYKVRGVYRFSPMVFNDQHNAGILYYEFDNYSKVVLFRFEDGEWRVKEIFAIWVASNSMII